MANIDVAYLTWDCVDDDGRLEYERIKFPKKARIKLNDKARAIIETYKDKCFDSYMLPIFFPQTHHRDVAAVSFEKVEL